MTITNIQVSPDVKTILPDVLIEYLCGLALSKEYEDYSPQTFSLHSGKLGGQNIQDIIHLGELHRVFGFTPVDCKLNLSSTGDVYKMTLAN